MEVLGLEFDVVSILRTILKLGLLTIAFLIIVPIGKKLIAKTIQKTAQSKKASQGRMKTLEKLLANVFSYTMIFIYIVMFFATLGIEIGQLIAVAGVIGLAIAFGAQGLVSDIVTGFFIILEQQLEIDDYVTTAGYDGVVEEIGLRTTKIRSFDGTFNYVPNRYIEGVSNHSRGNMQALVDIGISYNENKENIGQAIAILEQICSAFQKDSRFKDGPHAIGVQSIESTDIVLHIVGQTENGLQWECERDMRKQVIEAFKEGDISIP